MDKNNGPDLITFYVYNTEDNFTIQLDCEKGMTWKEYILSDYNSYNFRDEDYCISFSYRGFLYYIDIDNVENVNIEIIDKGMYNSFLIGFSDI